MVGAASAGLPRYLNPSDSLRLRRCRLRGGTIRARGRASRVEGFVDELAALHDIFLVNERAQFEFAVTNASLREVVARDEPGFTQWVHDVLDTWLIQSAGESVIPSSMFGRSPFGNISAKDRCLLQDALDVAVTPS